MLYGNLPVDVGFVDAPTDEMLFWMYCPISLPGSDMTILPRNLRQFKPITAAAEAFEGARYKNSYVYITAKTLWVSGEYIGNRPGWHSDGFGTDDINFIWYDRAPTEFIEDSFTLPDNCADSIVIMTERAEGKELVTYPDKHLLRLDPTVVHRCPVDFAPGLRTFVKISISDDRYDLLGNSINHELAVHWNLVPRSCERNHPSSVTNK